MGSRSNVKVRCKACRLHEELCACALVPRLQTRTRLLLLAHYKELLRSTNTGRLAVMALPNSELRIRGEIGGPRQQEGLLDPDRENLVLYPSDDAVELSADFVTTLKKPVTLIVPDGNWGQAGKVVKREVSLRQVRLVKLPAGQITAWGLREETKENGLATIEAIARAYGILEGPHVQQALEDFLAVIVRRTLWSRGHRFMKGPDGEPQPLVIRPPL